VDELQLPHELWLEVQFVRVEIEHHTPRRGGRLELSAYQEDEDEQDGEEDLFLGDEVQDERRPRNPLHLGDVVGERGNFLHKQ